MIGKGNWVDVNRESATVYNYGVGRMVILVIVDVSGL